VYLDGFYIKFVEFIVTFFFVDFLAGKSDLPEIFVLVWGTVINGTSGSRFKSRVNHECFSATCLWSICRNSWARNSGFSSFLATNKNKDVFSSSHPYSRFWETTSVLSGQRSYTKKPNLVVYFLTIPTARPKECNNFSLFQQLLNEKKYIVGEKKKKHTDFLFPSDLLH
jgi:hypothetical protein